MDGGSENMNKKSGLGGAPGAPRLAIVLPVFKHSVLVTEAIHSALKQALPVPYRLVIVNDGCAFPETHEVALSTARAHPDLVVYLRRPNGGLSAARNTGIDYVLTAWPSVEAIYFLDADNRLYPTALARAWETLEADPEIGWAYPDFDMFGQEMYFGAGGPYSVLKHLNENFCEAGSLVRRAVFERGVRFDESMRLGFEDWDFWLQVVTAGWRGKRVDAMGFHYRKRPESMLSNSERDRAEILGYMRRKHKALYAPSRILAEEHREAPRYAICLGDTSQVLLATDPTADAQGMTWGEFVERFMGCWADPEHHYCPNFLIFTTSDVIDSLSRRRLLGWCLWRLEDALARGTAFSALQLDAAEDDTISVTEGSADAPLGVTRRSHMLMTSRGILQECVRDQSVAWLTSLSDAKPMPSLFEMKVSAPDLLEQMTGPGGAVAGLLRCAFDLRQLREARGELRPAQWRPVITVTRSDLYRVPRDMLNATPVSPRVSRPGDRHVGFILPLAAFAGVEKVATSLAKALRAEGWTPHLFLFLARSVENAGELTSVFESINFLCDAGVGRYDPSARYFGTTFSDWSHKGDHRRAVGLLAGMDAVINAHSVDAHAIMGPLKRLGVRTIAHLHLVDRDPYGGPAGFPYQVLAYEHCYDAVLSISEKMSAWAHAMGMPAAKLVHAPNAASYELDAAAVQRIMDERATRSGKLRVAYIGRFDRQKGLDRLVGMVKAARARSLPVEWRFVGAAVLPGGQPDAELALIEPDRHPPARTPEELTEHLAWADVLVMPSLYEGVPLMLLEALRVGVVPVATRVGAVHEILAHGKNGFLVESGSLVTTVGAGMQCLQRLAADRALLLTLARAACESARAHDWSIAARAVAERLAVLGGQRAPNANMGGQGPAQEAVAQPAAAPAAA
jgi:glycosyltransferase involved in cell wall biosynthesis